MPIDETVYRRLEEAGRSKGRLNVEDVADILPLNSMSAAEVAEVVERLERAGIDVELDPVLSRPHPDSSSGNADGVVDLAAPAAPAISSPRVYPTTQADIVAMGDTLHHGHHGHKRSPTWTVNGVEMLPMLCIGVVALVLIIALG